MAVKLAETKMSRIYANLLSVNSCVINIFNSSSVRYSRSFTLGLIWNWVNGFFCINLLK